MSLDVFRGATIAAMILVNNPGTWSAIYPPLRHAPWHGWTPTDLIFPFFLFIVGVAIALAYGRRIESGVSRRSLQPKVLKRAAVLFGLGVFMAAWPLFDLGGDALLRDFSTLRIPGVLQRIAVCYLAATLLFLYASVRVQLALGAAILLGYWALLTLLPVPGVGPATLDPPADTLAAWVDRLVLGQHLWVWADRRWDPEGVLSTLPAMVTTLIGAWTGLLLRKEGAPGSHARVMGAWGLALTGAGLAWGLVFPINKQLWTSSYVLLTGGLALLFFAATYWITDVRGRTGWTRPFVVYGVNAITVFVASGLLAKTLNLIQVRAGEESIPASAWIWRDLFALFPGPPELGSLVHALVWVTGWYVVLSWMYRRGVVWKV